MHVCRNLPYLSAFHSGKKRKGMSNDPGLSIAGLRELGGLRNILAVYQLCFHLLVDSSLLQGINRCPAVWREPRVGNRDFLNAGVQQCVPLVLCDAYLGIGRCPYDQLPDAYSRSVPGSAKPNSASFFG